MFLISAHYRLEVIELQDVSCAKAEASIARKKPASLSKHKELGGRLTFVTRIKNNKKEKSCLCVAIYWGVAYDIFAVCDSKN